MTSTNLLDAALRYIKSGWAPVPVPLGKKGPILPAWQHLGISERDAAKYFNGAGNVGIVLGNASNGLVDVDLDCREALEFAPALLPTAGASFGRASKRNSHRLYRVEGAAPSLQFKDPITGDMLLELRGDGGRQTVFPPSIHPSGEPIEWEAEGDPSTIGYAVLVKAVTRLAARCLVARHLPGVADGAGLRRALDAADPRLARCLFDWLEIERAPESRHRDRETFDFTQPQPAFVLNGVNYSETEQLAASLAAGGSERSTYWSEPIAEACAQMREMRDNGANQGRGSWWPCLGVLAYCVDGDKFGHEWSSKHPKYKSKETQRELDGWRRKADGASLCEKIDRANPGVCGKCPHWRKIRSPIVLGRKVDEPAASQEPSDRKEDGPSKESGKGGGSQSSPEDVLIDELASLSAVAYEKRRGEAASQLGLRVGVLDKAVERRRIELAGEAEERPLFPYWTVEPWPELVDGDALILILVRRIRSHVILSPEAALVVALWIIFAWAHEDAARHSPILMVTSPEPDCGKTTLLNLVSFLVPRALASVSISAAALYRSIEKWRPTLIIDEADVIFVQNEDLRSAVNCGWTPGTGVVRCEGDDHEPRLFPTFCPKAIGLKGKKVPDTTASRAIVIELKRKLPHQQVADFQHVDDHGLRDLRRQILRWVNDNVGMLRNSNPTLPHGFTNRVAANWRLPLAIADAVGGEWPDKAREAAALIAKVKGTLDESIGIRLLADIRAVFDGEKVNSLFSAALIGKLTADPEKPWLEYNRGKPITQKQVANRLRDYGILSETVWIDGKSAKGYKRSSLEDAWAHYL